MRSRPRNRNSGSTGHIASITCSSSPDRNHWLALSAPPQKRKETMRNSMPKVLRLLALVPGAAATIQPLAHGQSAAINGEITGTVTDPSGAAIAGAVIQISNLAKGFKRETKVTESGLYRFTLLPLGTSDLVGQAVGFADAHRTGVPVNAGATVTV